MISLSLATRLGRDGLLGGGVAELAKKLEGVRCPWVLDRALGHDFEVAVRVAAYDGDLDDEAFVHERGQLAVRERELAGHGAGGELSKAGEVSSLDGRQVLRHGVLMAEGHEAGREAGAAGLHGSLDVAGPGTLVWTDGRLARRQGLAERGGGVLAGLHRGGTPLRTLFRGQGFALGPSAFGFLLVIGSFRHLDFVRLREQVESMSARAQIDDTLETGGKRKNLRGLEVAGGGESCSLEVCNLDGWTSFLVSVRGRTEATARRYRRLVERLLADVGKPIAQLSREDVERHLRRLHVAGRGESVRQGLVVAVRSLGEWCLAHGIIEANPGASLSGPRPYRREIKVLTVAEVSRLLWRDRPGTLPRDSVEMRDRVLLGVAYVAGLRASEVGPLEAEGVAWQEATQTFSVLVRHGKGAGWDMRLPLDRPVSRMLGAWLATRGAGRFLWGRPLTRGAVRKILLRRCSEVGIVAGGRRISPHILRHSLATHLLEAGVDIRKVQLLLRHRSIATTEKYLHADVDRLGAVLVRKSPLEARRRRRQGVDGQSGMRGVVAGILGELQELVPRASNRGAGGGGFSFRRG